MSIYLGGNNKLKGAYIGKINYRDKQGPCSDGFHVPLINEVEDLCEYMRQFGLCNREGFKQYLLTPPAGYRMPTGATISGQGSDLYYRTCEVSSTSGRSRCIMAYENYFIISQYFQSGGASIRPFKNEPVYPDNTWNILYGTIDNGISHNPTLGLISIVRGDNIITIADKNVGATTVYNSGDTLSEANCGKYFQRGNNYGFPRTGTITNTSTTKVDASSYGPDNYYYGETYILGAPTWMVSVNSNIWGGTSPNRTPIKRIVIFPDGVTEKQIRPELMGPGVYHNPTLGLISLSSDGENWITIADKNLGATTVWNSGDTLSEANAGKYYQWGNNYGFPFTGSVTTSSTLVNASVYGPGNYYSSSTFILNDGAWDTTDNGNLWGGETGTNEAMQGPAPSGFHIPTNDEWVSIYNIRTALGGGSTDGTNFGIALKLPFAGLRWFSTAADGSQGLNGGYWSSSRHGASYAYILYLYSSLISSQDSRCAMGFSIRPFKNTPVQPDETWTKLYEKVTSLCFTAEQANSTVQLTQNGTPTAVSLETSTDGATWTDYTIGNTITLSNVGDKVYMRNKSTTNTGFSTSTGNYYQFAMTGKIGASGDVTSLLNKNGTTTLTNYCFISLFQGCTNLTTAPELPATTLAEGCYERMFQGCTSLTTAPELPATTLYRLCYCRMFDGCTSLTTAPELPATTLDERCYRGMFLGCTSLTTPPELPATALADSCYDSMFRGCTSIKLSQTQTGEYQIPYRIPTTGTGTTAAGPLEDMFSLTGGTFTGTPTINTTYYLSNLHSKAEGSAVL